MDKKKKKKKKKKIEAFKPSGTSRKTKPKSIAGFFPKELEKMN